MKEVFTELGYIEITDLDELREAIDHSIRQIEELRNKAETLIMLDWNHRLNNKWLSRLFRRDYNFATFEEMWEADVLSMSECCDSSYEYSITAKAFEEEYELLRKAKSSLAYAEGAVRIPLELFNAINHSYNYIVVP